MKVLSASRSSLSSACSSTADSEQSTPKTKKTNNKAEKGLKNYFVINRWDATSSEYFCHLFSFYFIFSEGEDPFGEDFRGSSLQSV